MRITLIGLFIALYAAACTTSSPQGGEDILPEHPCPSGYISAKSGVPDAYLSCDSDSDCGVADLSPCSCEEDGRAAVHALYLSCAPRVDCASDPGDCGEEEREAACVERRCVLR